MGVLVSNECIADLAVDGARSSHQFQLVDDGGIAKHNGGNLQQWCGTRSVVAKSVCDYVVLAGDPLDLKSI